MFKCLECGHIFGQDEVAEWVEDYGEKMTGCPICCQAYEEVTYCEICCNKFLEEEFPAFGVCPECFDEFALDIDFCYKAAAEEGYVSEVKINDYLLSHFDADDIERILLKELKEMQKTFKHSSYEPLKKDFAYYDKAWFGEKILEHKKEGKE